MYLFSKKVQIHGGIFLVGWRSRRVGDVAVTKGIFEGSAVGYGVGILLG